MHGQGASAEVVVQALRAQGLSDEDARIAARAARGEAGFATSAVQDVPLPPKLPTTPPAEVPAHPCPKHAQWPVLGTCSRCGGFFCAQCAVDAGLSDLPASKLCPECDKRAGEAPQGIGGWLILPAIQLVTTPLVASLTIISSLRYLGHPKVGGLLLGEVLVRALFVAFNVVVASYFFRKKRVAIALMLAFYASSAVLEIGSEVLASAVRDALGTGKEAGSGRTGGLGGSVIWFVYFLVSKRVKATFTK